MYEVAAAVIVAIGSIVASLLIAQRHSIRRAESAKGPTVPDVAEQNQARMSKQLERLSELAARLEGSQFWVFLLSVLMLYFALAMGMPLWNPEFGRVSYLCVWCVLIVLIVFLVFLNIRFVNRLSSLREELDKTAKPQHKKSA